MNHHDFSWFQILINQYIAIFCRKRPVLETFKILGRTENHYFWQKSQFSANRAKKSIFLEHDLDLEVRKNNQTYNLKWFWAWFNHRFDFRIRLWFNISPAIGQNWPYFVVFSSSVSFSTYYNNLYYNFEFNFLSIFGQKSLFFSKSVIFNTWVVQNGHSSGSEFLYTPFSQFFLSDLGWFREPDLGDTNVAHLYNIRSSLSRRLTARGARESRMSLIHQ